MPKPLNTCSVLTTNPGMSDTPPGLKSRGFSETAPSYRCSHLACVRASTHNPHIMQDTILDHGRRRDLARLALDNI
jgi:hypothetical protein